MLYSPQVERNIIKKALKKQNAVKKLTTSRNFAGTCADSFGPVSFGVVDFVFHSSLDSTSEYTPYLRELENSEQRQSENSDFGLFLNAQVAQADVCMSVDTHSRFCTMSAAVMDYLDLGDQLEDTFDIIDSGKTLGEILAVPVSVNNFEMKLDFLVTNAPHHHIVLGVNELQKYKCIIDLANNHIKFGGHDGEEVQFLKENEIRKVQSHLDLKNMEFGFGMAGL